MLGSISFKSSNREFQFSPTEVTNKNTSAEAEVFLLVIGENWAPIGMSEANARGVRILS